MSNVFFISDTHWGHANILNFKRDDGTPLRDFKSVEEMDETMIDNWNKVVRANDVIYHLGDLSFGKNLNFLERLKGKKRLVRGNHDGHKLKFYAMYFDEVYGVRHLQKCWLTHIPIHPGSIKYGHLNLHGHLHANRVLLPSMDDYREIDYVPTSYVDTRYFNCSVEQINYTPIAVEEIRKITGIHIL